MNIFVLAKNPYYAAQAHCDKHVVKMILESAQLLSTAHRVIDGVPRFSKSLLKATHVNHPCAKWVRETSSNYFWLLFLMRALMDEYTLRYGKTHVYDDTLWLRLSTPVRGIDKGPQTPFVQCMPDQYKSSSAVSAYRNYYRGEKRRFATWKSPAVVPSWFNQ